MAPWLRGERIIGIRTVRAQRLARVGVASILAILALVSAAIPAVWVLMGRAPSWWHAPPVASEAAARGAEAVERAFSAELARHHEAGQPWSIEITEDAANAWLNHRLLLWLDHEGIELPWPVDAISARFGSTAIRVGVQRHPGQTPRIVGVTIRPWMDSRTGTVRATVQALHLGGLSVPGIFARRAGQMVVGVGDGSGMGRILGGEGAFEMRPIRLQDGRSVALIGITLQTGRVRVTFRAADSAGPGASDEAGGLP